MGEGVRVLVLDIDGVIAVNGHISKARRTCLHALAECARRHKIPIYINTARLWSDWHGDTMTRFIAKKRNHLYLSHQDVPTSKVMNMETIQARERIDKRSALLLVDDLIGNVRAVRDARFSAYHIVDDRIGITQVDVDHICTLFWKGDAPSGAVDPRFTLTPLHFGLPCALALAFYFSTWRGRGKEEDG